jgi:PKD repeat protein
MNNLKNMNKKVIIVVLSILLLVPYLALAQVETEKAEEPELKANIISEDFVRVGKKIIFDAGESILLEDSPFNPIYNWQFGDDFYDSGDEVVHQYEKTGVYKIKLILSQAANVTSTLKEILVYDTKAFLITDENKQEDLRLLQDQATESGVALKVLSTFTEEGSFVTEEKLAKEIGELSDYIKDSDLLIFYTRSALGIQAFSRYFQNLPDAEKQVLQKKFFVKITDGNMDIGQNISYQVFKIVQPKFILLTREESLAPVFQEKDVGEIINTLHSRGVEYRVIDEKVEKSPIWFLSHLVNSFAAKGVSSNTIYLILIIPFLTFVVVLARQVIGLQTFGVYTPVMITAAFFILGIWFGLLTFLFAVITSYLVKYVLNKFELLYLPKVALNLGFISLSFLIVMWVVLYIGTPIALSLAIFPMLVMSTVSEKFMAAQSEEGFKSAVWGVIETLLVVIIAYYVIIWPSFNNMVMSWPELVFVPLIFNLILAKFTGLRLGEYLRFRSLFKDHVEE